MRAAFALLAMGVAIPALAAGDTGFDNAAAAKAPFHPPSTPLIITRTVWRNLHDGKQIVVRRSYLVSISPAGEGFLVQGRQIGSSVDAPPQLEPLARLERARVDNTTLPISLDAGGIMRLGPPPPSPDLAEGGLTARRIIAQTGLNAKESSETEAFLTGLAAKGASVPWPVDLFNPREPQRRDRQILALPDGTTGTVTSIVTAGPRRADGLPAKVWREVVSELGGTVRISREEWTFSESTGP